MKILVTGGSGFLGKRLKKFYPDWFYISSKDCDLMDKNKVREVFGDIKPDAIIHLAARVGGIKDNINNQAEFFYKNTVINTNVLEEAHKLNINRILSSLSTCAFPDIVHKYPFEEENIFDGPPAKTNFSYGMTKRMLHVASVSYRNQYNRNYTTFSPSNIYGPGDNFGSSDSHFVASMIYKIANAKNGEKVNFWGTGKSLRQQLYIDDLCILLPELLDKHNSDIPLIVSPDENLSIEQMIESLLSQINKKITINFTGEMDGQFRKEGSNAKLKEMIPNFIFTKFSEGVYNTYNLYKEQNK